MDSKNPYQTLTRFQVDSLYSKLKANEAARRKIPIEDLVSIEYAAGYNAALNQMVRDCENALHDAENNLSKIQNIIDSWNIDSEIDLNLFDTKDDLIPLIKFIKELIWHEDTVHSVKEPGN